MGFWQFVAHHYIVISSVLAYFLLTEVRFMPKPGEWKGGASLYSWQYDVLQSLAASPPAQRLEAKYSVSTADGTTKTQSVSTEVPKA